MKLRQAQREDVIAAEARIDSEHHKPRLPDANPASCKWHLLTAFEDTLRNTLWALTRQVPVEEMDAVFSRFNRKLDHWKYALRYALDRIHKERPTMGSTQLPRGVIADAYTRAAEMLMRGDDYLMAMRAFGSYHAGLATGMCNRAGDFLMLQPDEHSNVYSALDQFTQGQEQGIIPITALIKSFLRPEECGLFVREIAHNSQKDGTRIKYQYNPFICNQMMQRIPKPPSIVPTGWIFPWGHTEIAHRVFEALHARCLYHFFAVHFGAIRHDLHGRGMDDICAVFLKSQLAKELAEISGVDGQTVLAVIEYLCYGHLTDTPDPALQPLIPISDVSVLAPTLLILSSNFPRNFLSLHARVDSPSFDKQSAMFETEMSERVERRIRERFSHYQMHSHVPGNRKAGEVDVVIADEVSHTILVGELRWLLAPGDPREVSNRKRVISEKVFQVERKSNAVSDNVATVLRNLGLSDTSAAWRVVGAVVVSGYVAEGPLPSRFPVIPIQILEAGLEHCIDIAALHHWFVRREWLPQIRKHFVTGTETLRFGLQRLQWGAFGVEHASEYSGHVRQTAQKANVTVNERLPS